MAGRDHLIFSSRPGKSNPILKRNPLGSKRHARVDIVRGVAEIKPLSDGRGFLNQTPAGRMDGEELVFKRGGIPVICRSSTSKLPVPLLGFRDTDR